MQTMTEPKTKKADSGLNTPKPKMVPSTHPLTGTGRTKIQIEDYSAWFGEKRALENVTLF